MLVCLIPTVLATILTATLPIEWTGEFVIAAVVTTLACVALMWRRRWPFAVALGASAALFVPGGSGEAILAMYASMYALGAYATGVKRWIAFAIAAVATISWPIVSFAADFQDVLFFAASNAFVVPPLLVALLIGISVRQRRGYIAALIARGDDLQLQRDQESQIAAATERARIAREMHDVVSHGITMMVTLAEGAAAQSSRDPERAGEAMRTVAATGRDALGEMRRLLGVLAEHADDDPLRPQPTADDMGALIDRFRAAGLPVRWTTRGEPITQPSLALAVHRIVQEALTNSLRHAPGTQSVEVLLEHGDATVTVQVDDDGGMRAASTAGAGRGLVGMRERAGLHGGSVEAGPRPTGGWRVLATLRKERA